MGKRIWMAGIVAALVLLLIVMAACGTSGQPASGTATTQPAGGVPANPGKQLVETQCTVCHGIDRVTGARHTPAEWQATVERMVSHGATLDASQQTQVINHLAEAYPK
jgi:cytochrome c5